MLNATRSFLTIALMAASCGLACSPTGIDESDELGHLAPSAEPAEAAIARFRGAWFAVPAAPPPTSGSPLQLDPPVIVRQPLLPPAVATSYRRVGSALVPDVSRPVVRGAWRSTARPAEVILPALANDAFVVRDTTSEEDVSISVRLVDATAAPAEIAAGYVVYRDALGSGAHLLQRPHHEGTEDYVYLPEHPEREALRFDVDVSRMAGVRLVHGTRTLEFLDASGDPRLRIAPPYAVDAAGQRMLVDVGVTGCAYDDDARTPWTRAVTPPGAATCRVELSWHGDAATRYPLIVDPAWSTTGSMVVARRYHAIGFSNWTDVYGIVVAGGHDNSGYPASSSEIRSPQKSWAALGDLNHARIGPVAAYAQGSPALPNHVIGLVVLGGNGGNPNPSQFAEVITAAGTWISIADMPVSIPFPTAISFIFKGNYGILATNAINDCILLDPNDGSWSQCPPLGGVGNGHSLTYFANVAINGENPVIAVGGETANGVVPTTRRIGFAGAATPASPWSPGADMMTGRVSHGATGLASAKKLLVAGGGIAADTVTGTSELYDPLLDSWTSVGSLAFPRRAHKLQYAGSCGFSSDCALVIGGTDGSNNAIDHVERFVAGAGQDSWLPAGATVQPHVTGHQTMYLSGGCGAPVALVAGGTDLTGFGTSTVEEFTPQLAGQSCTGDGECCSFHCGCGTCVNALVAQGSQCACDAQCANGHCADGVCCDTACNEDCTACSASAKGQGADGTCEPVASGLDPKGSRMI